MLPPFLNWDDQHALVLKEEYRRGLLLFQYLCGQSPGAGIIGHPRESSRTHVPRIRGTSSLLVYLACCRN